MALIDEIFGVAPEIRYVATYLGGILASEERPGLAGASSSESDKYEELIVNPAVLKLVTQRGNIDCGGADWVIVRYGNFYEVVMPVDAGHISIGVESSGDPVLIAERVLSIGDVASLRAPRR